MSNYLDKIIVISEEARLRTPAIEMRLDNLEKRLEKVEHEIKGLRRDMPSIVADAMREVLKEQKP